MEDKNFRFSLKLILLILFSISVLMPALFNQAISQEQPSASPTTEATGPEIKAGPTTLLPTAKNLSDVRAMIYPKKALLEHKYHAKSRCGILGAKLDIVEKFPTSYLTGIVYLKGSVTLRVKLDKKHSGYALTNGNGVKLYIDGKLFLQNDFLLVKDPKIKDKNAKHEWEEIWQYKLDTTRFPDGRHVISVDVCDHFDHYGADIIECYIRNKEK